MIVIPQSPGIAEAALLCPPRPLAFHLSDVLGRSFSGDVPLAAALCCAGPQEVSRRPRQKGAAAVATAHQGGSTAWPTCDLRTDGFFVFLCWLAGQNLRCMALTAARFFPAFADT